MGKFVGGEGRGWLMGWESDARRRGKGKGEGFWDWLLRWACACAWALPGKGEHGWIEIYEV